MCVDVLIPIHTREQVYSIVGNLALHSQKINGIVLNDRSFCKRIIRWKGVSKHHIQQQAQVSSEAARIPPLPPFPSLQTLAGERIYY